MSDLVNLQVIEGGKHRPFEVSGINGDEEAEGPENWTELVIVHRKIIPAIVGGELVESQNVVTPPFAVADREIGEAFCRALNDFNQWNEEFDWASWDGEGPFPTPPGRAA